MRPFMGTAFTVLKAAALDWWEDKVPQLGAALAFYTVLSLAPFMLILISLAGLFFGQEAAQSGLMEQAEELVGAEAAEAISEMIESSSKPSENMLGAIVGVITLLVGATGVF